MVEIGGIFQHDGWAAKRKIDRVWVHDNYNYNYNDDIALIRLESHRTNPARNGVREPSRPKNQAKPRRYNSICLAQEDLTNRDDITLEFAGWGNTREAKTYTWPGKGADHRFKNIDLLLNQVDDDI